MEYKRIKERMRLDKVASALNLMLRYNLDLDGIGWNNIHSEHYYIDVTPSGRFHAYRKLKGWIRYPDESNQK